MKITVAITNGGDGSAGVRFFQNEELAEAYMEPDNERFCEDVYTIELPLDERKTQFAQEKTEYKVENGKYIQGYEKGELIT